MNKTELKEKVQRAKMNGRVLFASVHSNRIRVVRKYRNYCKKLPIRDDVVVFEAYQATRMTCNPMALFECMKKDPYFKKFTFVWVIDGEDYNTNLYKNDKSVIFCKLHSDTAVKYLACAKYLINNKTFPYYFAKRPEQIHVTSWHATAFKTLGKEQFGSMGQYKNVTKNYLQADYLVMPNHFTADVMLDCCDVRSLFSGEVVEAGYPRSDFTINTDYQEMRKFLKSLLQIDINKKIVLYAPTWRGEVGSSIDITDVILENLTKLSDGLPEGYVLLLKIHDRTYTFVKDSPKLAQMKNVPDWLDTNKLLAGVDILITDYSSLCFDFVSLRRPILYFVYDREEYESTRGLYFDMEKDMPGPLCYTPQEVNDAIAHIDQVYAKYQPQVNAAIERFASMEDGHASERIIDLIFKGNTSQGISYRVEDTKKTRVLVHVGIMPNSRIALMVINQLNCLDYDKLDVSVVYSKSPKDADEYFLKKLHPAIKVYYRVPLPEKRMMNYYLKYQQEESGPGYRYINSEAAWNYRTIHFGQTRFDIAVDFSGSNSIWSLIFAKTDFAKKVMYLRNSVSEERQIDLKYAKQYFDELICVDEQEFEYYTKELKQYEGKAVLKLIPLPVEYDTLLEEIKEDLSYEMSYVMTASASLAKGKETFFFNEFINEYKEEADKMIEPCIQNLSQHLVEDLALAKVEFDSCKREFEDTFSLN